MAQSPYYLAVDIGASSGRHILGHLEDGRLVLEEIHRFSNGPVTVDGHLCWEPDRLFAEILAGMRRAGELGKAPRSVAVDTWAVDYVLLDADGARIGRPYCYRDGRTAGMPEKAYRMVPKAELYARTGIQEQAFNTVFQLLAAKEQEPETLETAAQLLLLPDYFHFLLTGVRRTEYTNASTTQLVRADTRDWDWALIDRFGLPRRLFGEISMPGCAVGPLREEIARQVGYACEVVLPATHDTASAVLAVPAQGEDFLYLSSGTWSLMGAELPAAVTTPDSMAANLTNEGGWGGTFRYLKNIMGLWMLQSVRRELPRRYTFDELCAMAEQAEIASLVDCNDARFLAPESMTAALQAACREQGEAVPETAGELARVIYRSLARCYAQAVEEIERISGRRFGRLHIVGGGSNDDYLNRLTAEAIGKPVFAGPPEATAAGNLLAQMLQDGCFPDVAAARACVARSFPLREYRA